MLFSRIFKTLAAITLLAGPCFSQNGDRVSAPASNGTEAVRSSALPANSDDYVIGSDDVIAINIWKEPEISRTVPVRPDGKITIPLVGDIQASGLTPKKLQDNITHSLQSYVASPEVTVIVQEAKSQKFNIVGEIAKPGSYPLNGPMTVLDAIAVGGGLKDFAKGGRIYILRSQAGGSHTTLPFDYKSVIKGKKLSENVGLLPGDTVVVP